MAPMVALLVIGPPVSESIFTFDDALSRPFRVTSHPESFPAVIVE
jgi:hypothetical protein